MLKPTLMFCSLAVLMAIFSCSRETIITDEPSTPASYDPEKHVYGTFQIIESQSFAQYTEYQYLCFIDIATGKLDIVPGNRIPYSNPFAEQAQAFDHQGRLLFTKAKGSKQVIVWELRPGEVARSFETESDISNLVFGEDSNTLYGLSSFYGELYKIDLLSDATYFADDNFPFRVNWDRLLYLSESHRLIGYTGILGESMGVNPPKADILYQYDLTGLQVVEQDTIPDLFGFVMHPLNKNVYWLH